ncbi:MAG: HEAT repeat domain-containing protein [Myxococcales bacterium]|nr:HEAT repeat domain-containing protein [Myxococcales bacterium]
MGWKEFVERHKKRRAERQVERNEKRLMNKWQPSPERKRAIDVLYEIGSEAAVESLLKRFTYSTEGSIVDEDEKSMVYERLLALHEVTVEPLKRFIKREEAVYWPLKALVRAADEDTAVATLLEAIRAIPESYGTDLKRKEQLVSNLREFRRDDVFDALIECLADSAEEIRFLAVDGVLVFPEDRAMPHLVARLADPEETSRVKMQILEMLVENKWKIDKKEKSKIAGNIPQNYFIGDTGAVLRR